MDNLQLIAIILFFSIILVFAYLQLAGKKDQVELVNEDGSKVTVDVEVADTMLKKARGLMFRGSLDENSGMLFTFDRPGVYSFWMVNTTIPLDAIFIAPDGSIVDIISMEPCGLINCPLYTPKAPAQYVLEVNKGFSQKHGIKAGSSSVSSFPK